MAPEPIVTPWKSPVGDQARGLFGAVAATSGEAPSQGDNAGDIFEPTIIPTSFRRSGRRRSAIEQPYRATHPWLSFSFDIAEFGPQEWVSFGRAQAGCAHLTGTPLHPGIAEQLHRTYLSKGAHATTAIEGNTLTEEEVSRMLHGPLDLPPSRRYLEQEVRNVLDAFRSIDESIRTTRDITLTPGVIRGYNELVLRDVGSDSEIRPGRIRTSGILVGRYRGPRAEDCHHLLERLCDWLLCSDFEIKRDDPLAFARGLTRALLAHLYLAWIHPFTDGNGRTARLVEYHLLAATGLVPAPAVHLLSNHYNQTRSRYYRVLDKSSRTQPWSPVEFIAYASGGLVDGIEEQLVWIKAQHYWLAWRNYVDEVMRPYDTAAGRRQRELVFALRASGPIRRSEIRFLTPQLAAAYAGKTSKTITRDINRLVALGLIERTPQGVRPLTEKMEAFTAGKGSPIS